jgi:hypothetical protein
MCVDTAADPQNCGRCGVACDPGEGCVAGQCRPPCPAGEEYCGGACTDTQSDALHCGDCGTACGMGDACVGGSCMCTGVVCGLCGVQDLGSTVPQTAGGSTRGAPDNVEPSCVPPGSGEAVFTFTAPSDGMYSIDTFGSDYDTTLVVLDLGCNELECDDDVDDNNTDSQIFMDLTQNETILVVVDGYEGSDGAYSLHIQPVGCPSDSLGSAVPQSTSGTTVIMPDMVEPSCADPGSPEATYSFTAPADGTYTFDTLGSSFDTVLHIHDGGCFGPELACDDDTVGGQSVVTVQLSAGQAVVVVVDGFGGDEGDYTLNVSQP